MKDKFRFFSISLISGWLLVFSLFSFILMLVISFLKDDPEHLAFTQFTLQNYKDLLDPIFLKIFFKSFYVAFLVTLVCLLLGYPFAYIISRLPAKLKNYALLLLLLPFWTSSVVRTYAMMSLLKAKGLLNSLLISLGLIQEPLQILFSNTAVGIGLVYNLLPFMILPIYSHLERFDFSLIEAAKDLGASKFTIFSKIVIPLSLPGIIGGIALVFLPAMTLFYISDLLGGAKALLLGNLIEDQFLTENNWPRGAATNIMLTLIMGAGLAIYWLKGKKRINYESVV
ncbi:ABC transporter permease subunit [Candidatus Berkiella cookevillensis]|uniref:ABC transporter permease subunit n=1 Tax=Candidatus Berkiella cookevillensis TaxID=437022 RepID=A0A0Q9YP60_9GAMM|nr:ABC transporter permease subunit [Candidatus Berkiella cookevillensis]MCS5708660.1 ABC transporter permease subunit [Candidatus Berkiella cookevillensis]